MRGQNLRAGQDDGDRGRSIGGSVSRTNQNTAPRDWPCDHCKRMGYTTKAQCWGHRGFRAVMQNNPTALSDLKDKIRETGRADSRQRWRQVGR